MKARQRNVGGQKKVSRVAKMNREDRSMQSAFKCLIVANTVIAFGAGASAQNIDIGKAEYRSGCASCHGIDAKGNGPVSKELKTHPADLTVLAKRNNGVFPVNAVYQIIDGREFIASHGSL